MRGYYHCGHGKARKGGLFESCRRAITIEAVSDDPGNPWINAEHKVTPPLSIVDAHRYLSVLTIPTKSSFYFRRS